MTDLAYGDFLKLSGSEQSTTPDGPSNEELLRSIASQLGQIQNQIDFNSEQNAYLVELLKVNKTKQLSFSSTVYTYPLELSSTVLNLNYQNQAKKIYHRSLDAMEVSDAPGTATVPLYKVLEFGSILLSFICMAGISSWLLNDVPLINPFAALLGLLGSPFFYAMGRAARK